MAKKPLGKDKFGVQKVMHFGDYFGDSLGQFALNAMSGLVGQLTYFYTDKVGVATAAIATVLLITKIVDAFTDLIMGNIIDHTPKGKEKYRPWLLKAGIPAAIALVLLFTVPANAASGVQIAYALVTNILLSAVLYTAIAVPYSSLMTVRTNSQEERGVMGTWRGAMGYVAGFIMAIMIIPITNMLGGNQSAWIKFAVIIGLALVLTLLICYLKSRETATEAGTTIEAVEEEDPVPFGEAVGKLFHNKYWVIVLIVNLMSCIIYGISGAAETYYCKWIFGDDNLVGILGGVGLIPTFIGFASVGILVKKLGVTGTLKFSFAVGILSNTLMIFLHNNFTAYMILGCFTTYATIPMMCLVGVMTSMSIDYNEYKYGVKMVASSNAAYSFGGKVGTGIGGSLIGWMLGAVGYDASLTVATNATKMAIYGFSFIIPLVMFIIMFILAAMFNLEKTLPAMKEEIAERKAENK
ncbi:MAG: glycoside-pentoside-hexuronide (GPH):cation symporter [Eubacterium sp.]|nr:glycoside-pentoside-hexuronide (GPH):cation symporter [Eubacterium sp.]